MIQSLSWCLVILDVIEIHNKSIESKIFSWSKIFSPLFFFSYFHLFLSFFFFFSISSNLNANKIWLELKWNLEKMYITGAVEILLNYISPEIALFGDFEADKSILYHNIRVYGTIFLIIIGILVFIGVRFVSKFAPIALVCVLASILSVYLGIFVNYNGQSESLLYGLIVN